MGRVSQSIITAAHSPGKQDACRDASWSTWAAQCPSECRQKRARSMLRDSALPWTSQHPHARQPGAGTWWCGVPMVWALLKQAGSASSSPTRCPGLLGSRNSSTSAPCHSLHTGAQAPWPATTQPSSLPAQDTYGWYLHRNRPARQHACVRLLTCCTLQPASRVAVMRRLQACTPFAHYLRLSSAEAGRPQPARRQTAPLRCSGGSPRSPSTPPTAAASAHPP